MNNKTIQLESKDLSHVKAANFHQIPWLREVLKKLCQAVKQIKKGGLRPKYELERNRILKDNHQNSLSRLSIADKQKLGLYPWIH